MNTQARTSWGGFVDEGSADGCGFFRAACRGGLWWLIDPDGGRFLSKGVTTVFYDQDKIQNTERIPYAEACRKKYADKDAWRAAVARRLLSWGFNTLGSWSDNGVADAGLGLASTPTIDLGASFVWQRRGASELGDAFPDVFDPEFDAHVRRRTDELCRSRRDDPKIIGWFTDNELQWGPDWRGTEELLTLFLNMPERRAGCRRAVALLKERYGSFDDFNTVWNAPMRSWEELAAFTSLRAPYQREPVYQRNEAAERERNTQDSKRKAFVDDCEAFMGCLAERYFAAVAGAIRAVDANHLILGCRFAYPPQVAVIEAAGRGLDVISFNCYGPDPTPAIQAFAFTEKPCLIGEFSFRGADSGLPNTVGAGPVVPTQAERARCFERFATAALLQPNLVGYHWFEHADQPAEGRFDGENSNYGTVNIRDEVYRELTDAMTALNARAEDVHAAAKPAQEP